MYLIIERNEELFVIELVGHSKRVSHCSFFLYHELNHVLYRAKKVGVAYGAQKFDCLKSGPHYDYIHLCT